MPSRPIRVVTQGPSEPVRVVTQGIADPVRIISGTPSDPVRVVTGGISTPIMIVAGSLDPIGDGLRADAVAYWKLDEASGVRFDSTGRGNNLSNHTNTDGVVQTVAGKIGNAISPEREPALADLQCDSNSDLRVSDTSFTFTVWFMRNDANRQIDLLSKEDWDLYTDEYVIGLDQPINRIHFWFSVNDRDSYPTVNANSYGNVPLSQWIFVAAWFDLSTLTLNLQINNATIDSVTTTSTPDLNSFPFVMGAINNLTNIGTVCIDEVGFWKRTLTQDERDYLWNSGAGRTLFP